MNWELQTSARPRLAKATAQYERRRASSAEAVIAGIRARDELAAEQFDAMWRAYDDELSAYIEVERPFWAEKFDIRSGTLTNLELGLSWMATLGTTDLNTGCIALQEKTHRVLSRALKKWTAAEQRWRIERRVIGNFFEHHAIVVIPLDGSRDGSWYFDPWISQRPAIYTTAAWMREFSALRHLGGNRLDW